MLHVLMLIAWDGTREEIDRRKVREAYVDRTSEDGAHTVVLKEDGKGAVHVGIDALEEIEAWLGLKLPVLTVKDGNHRVARPEASRCEHQSRGKPAHVR
jgi:hypothetical protein